MQSFLSFILYFHLHGGAVTSKCYSQMDSKLQKHLNIPWNHPKNRKCKVKNINMCFFFFLIIVFIRDLIKPTLKDQVNTDTSKPGKILIDISYNKLIKVYKFFTTVDMQSVLSFNSILKI